jgi:hypothetical protein
VLEHACDPSYTESINRRTTVQVSPGKNWRPYQKNNQDKKGWWGQEVTQVLAQGPEFNP